jgi:two-component system, chemotaxis family, sensor kinase CheA
MDPMQEIMQMFFVECEELLEAMQEGLEALNEQPGDIETINTVFRAVHSIKGGAAAFSLNALVEFAHTFETTLDAVRSGRLEASEDVLRTLTRSADVLGDLVVASRDGGEVDPERVQGQVDALVTLCNPDAARPKAEKAPEAVVAPQADEKAVPAAEPEAVEVTRWRIRFRPFPALFERGNEPAHLLRELSELGEMRVTCDISALPPLATLVPGEAYLGWEIDLASDAPESAIQEVFDFVDGDCELTIERVGQDQGSLAETVSAVGLSPGSANVAASDIEYEEASEVVADAPAPSPEAIKPAASAVASPRKATAAPAPASGGGGGGGGGATATVRVDLERVDRLINLVGELVINQAMLSQSVIESGLANSSAIAVGLDEFKHLTREVQESVLAIRAQPVKSLFQRMARIVREAADHTGKQVKFITEGEMTEVDKTVIERLADPLTHMIRNAVDHGLEMPDVRRQKGKTPEGTISLTAEHRSGRVLIEVTDNGAGINRERVLQIAVEKGLVAPDAQLSNSEIDNLLFLPGFSTAKVISDLSGRGVGMDVVKRSIAALGGRIVIASQPGEGSTFSISLPLTLAILDGMIVSVADQTVVVPLSAILEMLKPEKAQIHPLGADERVVQVRGEFVPIIDVGHQLGFGEALNDYQDRVMLLIETSDGEQRALVVDGIQDQRQVVIKGLEENYGEVSGIAAATILGDGRIALILDTDAIVSDAARNFTATRTSFALAG